MENFQ